MDNKPKDAAEKRRQYLERLFSRVPLYDTKLVKEGEFPFPNREQVSTPEGITVVLQEYYATHDREEALLVLLDVQNTVIGLSRLSVGGLTRTFIEPRQVFKIAVLGNAASVILAHNHPSGNPEPSKDDLSITRKVAEAGRVMGIPLQDHLIITADNGYTSLAQRGIV